MDLTKRLGISDDILKAATEVLEGKKISHPNQKEISTAAPPHDEITAADFKALKAKKKMHRVEGFDRNKKRYESPLFETYEEALAFYNKIRKSAPLTNLKIVDIDEAKKNHDEKEKMEKHDDDKEDVKEAKELNTANANDARAHDCAKHVVHEQWGVGETVPTMHAEPDADGNIAWYDVMFEHGIEHQVPTSALEITLSETHVHKKSKRMTEQEQHGGKEIKSLKTKKLPNVIMNPEQAKEEVEQVEEKTLAPAELKKREEVAKAIKRKQPNMPMGMKMAIATKVAKDVAEEVETLDEGRNAGPRDPLKNTAHPLHDEAVKKFKELTGGRGNPSSYFHRENKFKDHADAAIEHAKKVHSAGKSSEGEDESTGDQDQHPAMQVKKAADLAPTSANPKGGAKVQGKHMSHADAKQVLGDYMKMKPSEKENAAKNMHSLINN